MSEITIFKDFESVFSDHKPITKTAGNALPLKKKRTDGYIIKDLQSESEVLMGMIASGLPLEYTSRFYRGIKGRIRKVQRKQRSWIKLMEDASDRIPPWQLESMISKFTRHNFEEYLQCVQDSKLDNDSKGFFSHLGKLLKGSNKYSYAETVIDQDDQVIISPVKLLESISSFSKLRNA